MLLVCISFFLLRVKFWTKYLFTTVWGRIQVTSYNILKTIIVQDSTVDISGSHIFNQNFQEVDIIELLILDDADECPIHHSDHFKFLNIHLFGWVQTFLDLLWWCYNHRGLKFLATSMKRSVRFPPAEKVLPFPSQYFLAMMDKSIAFSE